MHVALCVIYMESPSIYVTQMYINIWVYMHNDVGLLLAKGAHQAYRALLDSISFICHGLIHEYIYSKYIEAEADDHIAYVSYDRPLIFRCSSEYHVCFTYIFICLFIYI